MEEETQCPTMLALEFDMSVRKEANLGFQQIRSIERELRQAPQGSLGRVDGPDDQALRATILSASATIVGSFSKIITLLSSPPTGATSSAPFRNNSDNGGAERISSGGGAAGGGNQDRNPGRAESPLSTAHTSEAATPPHSPRRAPASSRFKSSTSPAMSPAHTSLSGSGLSDGSPFENPGADHVGLDSDGEGAGGRVGGANDVSTSATPPDPEHTEPRTLSRKRKFMPKYTCKQRATGLDPANDGPPEDGHTWRKYGQKEILGSKHPRSYYRCTHKHELGCPAIKYVQRSDEELTIFDVTYRGNHTCQAMQQNHPWPFPFSREQIAMVLTALPAPDPSIPPIIPNFPRNLISRTPLGGADDLILGGRSPFSLGQLNPGMPVDPNAATSQLMQRLGLNAATSLDLDIHQNEYNSGAGVKLEGNAGFNMGRSSRDRQSLFAPGSSLRNVMLQATSSQPGSSGSPSLDDGQSPNISMEGSQHGRSHFSHIEIQRPEEQIRQSPEIAQGHYNVERSTWGQDIVGRQDFHQPQHSTPTSTVPTSSQSLGNVRFTSPRPVHNSSTSASTSSDRGWLLDHQMEEDPSDLMLTPAHSSPYTMGFLDHNFGVMDCEPFISSSY